MPCYYYTVYKLVITLLMNMMHGLLQPKALLTVDVEQLQQRLVYRWMSGRYTAARTAVCGWGVSFFNIVTDSSDRA